MLVFPQLETGALSQFPIRKQRRKRTVVNTAPDGRSIKLADPNGEVTEWQLSYSDLSDRETSALEEFFKTAEGSLNGFTFLDPTANLLAWSDKLDGTAWAPVTLATTQNLYSVWFDGGTGWAPDLAGYTWCGSGSIRSAQSTRVCIL